MTELLAPAGIRVVPDTGLRRVDGGRLLIGGAPLRLLRLSDRGAAVFDAWLAGTPVADVRAARRLARRLVSNGMMHPRVEAVPAADVTVVIPVRDDASGLDRCLTTLGEHRVVVVDDGSADAESIRLVARSHGSRLMRRPTSGGPGAARAEGVAIVDSPLVAFVDADVEAAPEWIERLAGHFVDPVVAVVAPRVRSPAGPTLRERYERDHSPLDLGAAPSIVGPGRPVSYVPTAAMVLRTDVFRELEGFDDDMRQGEDVDFVWRVVDAGHVVRYEPDVEVLHAPRTSWRSWTTQRRQYGATAAPLGLRHRAKVAPARCSAWSAAAWGAAAARHPFIGLGVAAGTTAALVPKLEGVPEPAREAIRLAGSGHLHAGLGLARAVTRAWWPIALLVAWLRPRLRPSVAAAFVGPALVDWARGCRPAGPVRSVALRIADDMAYGLGVWEGTVRHRTPAALAPEFRPWPGSGPAVERSSVSES